MPSNYQGNAANVTVLPVVTSNPVDADAFSASAIDVPLQTEADYSQYILEMMAGVVASNWSQYTIANTCGDTALGPNSMVYAPSLNHLYTCIASGSGNIQAAADGYSFAAPVATGIADVRVLGFNGTMLVAAGNNGGNCLIATSTNGTVWTVRSPPAVAAVPFGISWCQALSLWVITLSTSQSLTSPDGITWTLRATPIAFGAITTNGTIFVALGASIYTSVDGIAWVSRASAWASGGGGAPFVALAFGAGLFVAANVPGGPSGGQVLTSPDGITWTLVATATVSSSFGVALAFVGRSGGPGAWVVLWSVAAVAQWEAACFAGSTWRVITGLKPPSISYYVAALANVNGRALIGMPSVSGSLLVKSLEGFFA